MAGPFSGWAPALRIARRDSLRSKGRSILVLVMIALPVLAVSAADVVYKTSDVNSIESLDRRLGGADARVSVDPYTTKVVQWIDPERSASSTDGRHKAGEAPTIGDVRAALGRDVPATTVVNG